MFLVLLFCVLVFSTEFTYGDSCTDHTQVFNGYQDINAHGWFFLSKTFFKDSFEPILTRKEYIKYLLLNDVQCDGRWCFYDASHRGQYDCVNTTTQCYHMEHIIPKGNSIPTLTGCPENSYNVLGNLVMSYGLWNMQLSNRFLGEKTLVYGEDIVKSAYGIVYGRCLNKTFTGIYPDDLCLTDQPNTQGIVVVSLIGILLATCSMLGCVALASERLKDESVSTSQPFNTHHLSGDESSVHILYASHVDSARNMHTQL